MNLVERFEAYMHDFELTAVDDDWSRIRAHLTDDFLHERNVRPLFVQNDKGADLAIERWKRHVEHFDRQFDRRIFVPLGPPVSEGNTVRMRWIFLGVLENSQTFVDEGVEVAEYRDEKICILRGAYHPFAIERMKQWGKEFGHLVPKIAEYNVAHHGAGK